MRRARSLGAEVPLGGDDPPAEEPRPEAVHLDAGRERVLVADQPAGEGEAVGRGPGVEAAEGRGDRGLDLLTTLQEVAPEHHVGVAAALGGELLHHGGRHHVEGGELGGARGALLAGPVQGRIALAQEGDQHLLVAGERAPKDLRAQGLGGRLEPVEAARQRTADVGGKRQGHAGPAAKAEPIVPQRVVLSPLLAHGHLEPQEAVGVEVQLGEPKDRRVIHALARPDGPSGPRVQVEGGGHREVRLLEARGPRSDEQGHRAARPEAGLRHGVGGRPRGRPPQGLAGFAQKHHLEPLEPQLQVPVRAAPHAQAVDLNGRREGDLPPGVRLGGGVGHGPVLVDAARVAVHGELRGPVEACGRLGGRGPQRDVDAVRVEHLDLRQGENAPAPGELNAEPCRERDGPLGSASDLQVGHHEVPVPPALSGAPTGQLLGRKGREPKANGRPEVAAEFCVQLHHVDARPLAGFACEGSLLAGRPEPLRRHEPRHALVHVDLGAGELSIEAGELRVEARLGLGLRRGRRGEPRLLITAVRVGGLIEQIEEPVVLGVADGVVLVAVALRAAGGQPHPDLHARVHPVLHGEHAELLVVRAPLRVGHGVPVERGGQARVHRRVRDQVPRELLEGELIKGQVPVVRLDHPVAVAPDRPKRVGAVPAAIRVAGEVEPDRRPALRVLRRGEQPVHRPLDLEGVA